MHPEESGSWTWCLGGRGNPISLQNVPGACTLHRADSAFRARGLSPSLGKVNALSASPLLHTAQPLTTAPPLLAAGTSRRAMSKWPCLDRVFYRPQVGRTPRTHRGPASHLSWGGGALPHTIYSPPSSIKPRDSPPKVKSCIYPIV